MALERRLRQIEQRLSLSKKNLEVCDMTDDELAQVITGDPNARACNITYKQLEAIIRETK